MPMEHSVHMDGALHPCRVSTPFIWMELSIHADGALRSYGWSSPSMPMDLSVHMDGAPHPCRWSSPFIWMELPIHADGALRSYGWSSPSIRMEHSPHPRAALRSPHRRARTMPNALSDRSRGPLVPVPQRSPRVPRERAHLFLVPVRKTTASGDYRD